MIGRASLLAGAGALVCLAAVALLSGERAPREADAGEPRAADARAIVAGLADAVPDHGYEPPSGPWTLSLPDDLGGHEAARMETWSLAAHLEDEAGRPVGVQFALFRVGIRRVLAEAGAGSPWDLGPIHVAHLSLARDGEAAGQERVARGRLGSASHDNARGEVWIDDWTLSFDPDAADGGMTLAARLDGEPVRLELEPAKAALSGDPDGTGPSRGFAFPRMRVTGSLGRGEERRRLAGSAWLDRAWGEIPLPGVGPIAHDRLVLQLEDGTDLSLLRSRRRDGRGIATLDGLIVGADGGARRVADGSIAMEPGAATAFGDEAFALDWSVTGPELELTVTPVIEDQRHAIAGLLWSGLVRAEGQRNGRPVTGLGTLQTVGNARR